MVTATDDPDAASIANQAKSNIPISIPWSRKPIFLGKGLSIGAQSELALRNSPLLAPDRYVFVPADATNSFKQVSSKHATATYEHLDVQFGVSAGNAIVGASVQGEYAKTVAQNRDSNKVSLQATLRVGQITFGTFPRLTPGAFELLRRDPETFHAAFGTYYVHAISIGADASTFLSTSTGYDLNEELRDIQVKARVLWWEVKVVDIHDYDKDESNTYDITYNGFDTLNNYQRSIRARDLPTFIEVQREASRNVWNGKTLVERVKDAMGTLGMDCEKECSLTRAQIEAAFNKGLVVEVLFMPFARLRDYVAATTPESVLSLPSN